MQVKDTGIAEESDTDVSTHRAAFMVLIDKNGNYIFEPDINKPVIPERQVTASEAKSAMRFILDDIRSQEIAATIMAIMTMQARAAQEQMQNQQILQQMKMPR